MTSVNIAELKSKLSAYLQRVRAGEEIVIRDRRLPVARLVPFAAAGNDPEELALAAAGKLSLPKEPLDEAFWSLGKGQRTNSRLARAARTVISRERNERDGRVLGR
jgi:prevent-host-death family protein